MKALAPAVKRERKESDRKYRTEHLEERRAYDRRYYAEHKEEINARVRIHNYYNRIKININRQVKRAIKRQEWMLANDPEFTIAEYSDINFTQILYTHPR